MNRLVVMLTLIPLLCTGLHSNKNNWQTKDMLNQCRLGEQVTSGQQVSELQETNNQQVLEQQETNSQQVSEQQETSGQQIQKEPDPSTQSMATELTESFLQGVWVNENGYLCEYSNGTFHYGAEIVLSGCSIQKNTIKGIDEYSEKEMQIKIEIIDQNSIKIEDKTAYRSGSEAGKIYIDKIREKILGDWFYFNNDIAITAMQLRLTSKEFGVYDEDGKRIENCTYQLKDSLIKVTFKDQEESMIVQFDHDCMLLSEFGEIIRFYRKDSKEYKEILSNRDRFLEGKWIVVGYDRKPLQQWEITKDKLTYKSYKKNEKSGTHTYKFKRKEDGYHLRIGRTSYTVTSYGNSILVMNDKTIYYLIAYDSTEGKEVLERLKTQNKDGKIEKRTYSYETQNPVLKKVTITLNCKNNIILKDMMDIFSLGSEFSDASYLSGAQISIGGQYKNASVTLNYDPARLLYDCEDDLGILYIEDDHKTLLKAKVNKKNHTLTAAYQGDGRYMLVDHYQYEGNKRDSLTQNPKNTAWAFEENTGDILNLVDYDYLKKSKGDFVVTTPEQLASAVYYVNTVNGYVVIELENDIDLSNYEWAPMGWPDTLGKYYFTGALKGNNHTIRGLHMKVGGDWVGLIGCESGCRVQDLTIEDADLLGGSYIGVLTGKANGGSFINCKVSGKIKAYGMVGALLGSATDCEIDNCKADVLVNGKAYPYLTFEEASQQDK